MPSEGNALVTMFSCLAQLTLKQIILGYTHKSYGIPRVLKAENFPWLEAEGAVGRLISQVGFGVAGAPVGQPASSQPEVVCKGSHNLSDWAGAFFPRAPREERDPGPRILSGHNWTCLPQQGCFLLMITFCVSVTGHREPVPAS